MRQLQQSGTASAVSAPSLLLLYADGPIYLPCHCLLFPLFKLLLLLVLLRLLLLLAGPLQPAFLWSLSQ